MYKRQITILVGMKKWQCWCHPLVFVHFCKHYRDPSRTKLMVTKLYRDNFMKQTLREIRGNSCDSSVIVKQRFSRIFLLIFSTSLSVRTLGRPLRSSSCTLVRPFLNIRHHCLTPPSLITFFPYTSHSRRWMSTGLQFSVRRNHITECTSQLTGFSIAALILKLLLKHRPIQMCIRDR